MWAVPPSARAVLDYFQVQLPDLGDVQRSLTGGHPAGGGQPRHRSHLSNQILGPILTLLHGKGLRSRPSKSSKRRGAIKQRAKSFTKYLSCRRKKKKKKKKRLWRVEKQHRKVVISHMIQRRNGLCIAIHGQQLSELHSKESGPYLIEDMIVVLCVCFLKGINLVCHSERRQKAGVPMSPPPSVSP
uniref:Uncharacterized protein n=1 Tax=Physcomitrium patens TaxID=3218 RepID=A0A2K1J2S2_PHYPA|nr:hypothetical protein PHYPA_021677 [Physcomitrium patens]